LYNKANTDRVHEGLKAIRTNLSKMRMDFYSDSIDFSLENYPWYFDERSEDYQSIQIALAGMRGGQDTNLHKMNEIRAYSDTLINVIERELVENYE